MSESQPAEWNPELYDEKHSFVWKLASSLVDLLAPKADERILDIGCGTGQLTKNIADSGADVVGFDSSPAMIDKARRLYPGLHFDEQDAHDFSYGERFDAVFSNATLHWINDPASVVRCISRCLKPGGRLVVEFGGKGNVNCLSRAAESAALTVLRREVAHPWYFPSIAEFSALLESVDLEVTQAVLFDRPTPLEGDKGLRNWLRMFGNHWLDQIPDEKRNDFLQCAEDVVRADLYRDGQWFADYRRIRIFARRL